MADKFYVNWAGDLAHTTKYRDGVYRAYIGSRFSHYKQLRSEKGINKFMVEHGWLELPDYITSEDVWAMIYGRDRYGCALKFKWLYTLIAHTM